MENPKVLQCGGCRYCGLESSSCDEDQAAEREAKPHRASGQEDPAPQGPARRLLDVELRRAGRPEATVRLQARHRHGPLQRRQAVEGILRRRSGEPLAAQRQALLHEERRRDFDAKDGVGSGPKPIGPVPARMSTPPSGPGGDTRVK